MNDLSLNGKLAKKFGISNPVVKELWSYWLLRYSVTKDGRPETGDRSEPLVHVY